MPTKTGIDPAMRGQLSETKGRRKGREGELLGSSLGSLLLKPMTYGSGLVVVV
jgi:hypothetical protein